MTENTFGSLLKEARKRKGLSLRELARRVGVSHPYLSQLENEHNNNPSRQIVYSLSEELGLSFAHLLSLTDDDFGLKENVSPDIISALKQFNPNTIKILMEYDDEDFNKWAEQDEEFKKHPFMIEDLKEFIQQLSTVEEETKKIARLYMQTDDVLREVRHLSGGSITLERVLMTEMPITLNGRVLDDSDKKKILKIAEIIFNEE